MITEKFINPLAQELWHLRCWALETWKNDIEFRGLALSGCSVFLKHALRASHPDCWSYLCEDKHNLTGIHTGHVSLGILREKNNWLLRKRSSALGWDSRKKYLHLKQKRNKTHSGKYLQPQSLGLFSEVTAFVLFLFYYTAPYALIVHHIAYLMICSNTFLSLSSGEVISGGNFKIKYLRIHKWSSLCFHILHEDHKNSLWVVNFSSLCSCISRV